MNLPNINVLKKNLALTSSSRCVSGYIEETYKCGAHGPQGPQGAQGPQGPAGSGSYLTFEYLTYTGTPLDISTTLDVTYITNISYIDAEFNLANAIDGFVKYISLTGSDPVQIRTIRGSFNLSPTNPRIQLVYVNNEWNQIRDKTPWYADTQQGSKLIGTGGVGTSAQGASVALSADGNTLAIGGYFDDSNTGAVWIFVRTGTSWSQQGSKLVGTGATGAAQQGLSVALSADGNTLAVGGRQDDSDAGAVWVFVRSGTVWAQQGSKLVGTGSVGTPQQGFFVALSADGNTLAIGAPIDDTNIGAVWVFVRSGAVWAQQGSKLVGTGATGTAQQGYSVALSADGNTLAVGGFEDDSQIGASWIFVRSGTTWAQQGSKLIGTGALGTSKQGFSVALSADGNTLAIGGQGDDPPTGPGASWIFIRAGTTWTQQGSKLIGTGFVGVPQQGWRLDLSADGNTLAIGGIGDNGFIGAIWIFTRFGTAWTQQGSKLIGTGATGTARQGSAIALSADGNTLAVGGFGDATFTGATWIFV